MTIITGRRRGAVTPPDPYTIPYTIPAVAPYNAPSHIPVPTYDGSGQPVHPDVIDFYHVLPSGTWRGHRFWMVMTPYPFSQDAYENPSILVSPDGINWSPPAGLTNPIAERPPVGYNSDTDIIYDAAADQLVVLFRRTNEGLRITHSDDGVAWSAHASVDITDWQGLSPSVLRDGSVWRMWYNQGLGTKTAAALEGPWGPAVGTTGGPSPIWHSNVQHAPGGGFHLLAHTAVGPAGVLQAASSLDGISWATNPTPLVTAGTAEWSASGLYRPALTLHENLDRYRVWYSAQSEFGVWRLSYTEIPLTEWPAPPPPA